MLTDLAQDNMEDGSFAGVMHRHLHDRRVGDGITA